ncbi:hypothetical protein [Acetivibrio cellulolyticus]|uniref:hypothetical protein n=1 Tax=Acetivibrio cellulolyticus TaxID=35830 RepID=UPI0001E2C1EB|nr:hypothetical protein [Acetivibrio cellulolyticus]
MKSELSEGNNKNILSLISLCMSLVIFLLIVNWLFKITPFQKLAGMPLLIAPFVGVVGFVLSLISFKQAHNKLSMMSLICNVIMFVLPFLYWIVGTLIFGP